MKQETLQDAAENSWLFDDTMCFKDRISYVNGFISGYELAQERIKEDIAYNKGFKDAMIKYRTI